MQCGMIQRYGGAFFLAGGWGVMTEVSGVTWRCGV